MKIKTADLTGPALDWAVATCDGYEGQFEDEVSGPWLVPQEGFLHDEKSLSQYSPSTSWSQGGPIIEREWLDITSWPNESDEEQRWQCHQYDAPKPYQALGPTSLIAAMRCVVASRLGDEVDVPDELV